MLDVGPIGAILGKDDKTGNPIPSAPFNPVMMSSNLFMALRYQALSRALGQHCLVPLPMQRVAY
jgi:hypothetical protein